MWIDLIDKATGTALSLDEVLRTVAEQHAAALDAAVAEAECVWPSFRHAVVLVDRSGKPLPHSGMAEELAGPLLADYGRARGGEPGGRAQIKQDYGRVTAYAMWFYGGPTEPTRETSLVNDPTTGQNWLEGKEERYIVSPVEASA